MFGKKYHECLQPFFDKIKDAFDRANTACKRADKVLDAKSKLTGEIDQGTSDAAIKMEQKAIKLLCKEVTGKINELKKRWS